MRWRLLTRISALLLVVLAGSPFTAPFSTCDIADLPASHAAHDGSVMHGKTPADKCVTAAVPAGDSGATPGRMARERARLGGLATDVRTMLHIVLRL